MITNDLLRQLPARLRSLAGGFNDEEAEDGEGTGLLLEQAADVAEELLRLRRRISEAGIRMDENEDN